MELALYDGTDAVVILLDKAQTKRLIEQANQALLEHDKDNVLN